MPKSIKPPRLQDLARRAGVSVATASLALSDHTRISESTRARVRSLSEKMGYKNLRQRPQQATPVTNAFRVGLFLLGDSLRGERSEHNAGLVHRLMDLTASQGLRFEIGAIGFPPRNEPYPERAFATLRQFARGLGGLILMGYVDAAVMATVHAMRLPSVVLGQIVRNAETDRAMAAYNVQRVSPDAQSLGRIATNWLIAKGHRRISFVSEQTLPGLFWADVLDGYRLALLADNRGLDPQLVENTALWNTNAPEAFAKLAALADPPTGFLVADTRIAESFLEEARRAGRPLRPDQIVTAGASGMAAKYHVSGLPVMEVDTEGMADASLTHLLHIRDHPPNATLQVLLPVIPRNMD